MGEILSALRASSKNAISKQQEAKELLDILNAKKVTKKKGGKKK